MHDTLPEQTPLWRHIRDAAERAAERFDYHWIETPIVEDQRVFNRTAGAESDIVTKELYAFRDRGQAELALRPEGTAGVVRAYIEHGMASRPQPQRLCYWGPFFRYDRPQAGRYRQLWQFGAELVGDPSPSADAELIDLQRSFYSEVGLFDLVLRINSVGTPDTRRRYQEVLRDYLRPHLGSLSPDSERRFETNVLRILDSKERADREAIEGAPSILDHLDESDQAHFEGVLSCLDGIAVNYIVDPRIVRGLDYYSRTVWEFEPAEGGTQSTVGAGGRYDGLVELLGGKPTPAVGFGTGIERIALNLTERGLAEGVADPPVDVFMVTMGTEGPAAAMKAAWMLRRAGYRVRNATAGRSARAQLRSADAAGAPFVLIVGDIEARRGFGLLKSMRGEGRQRQVSFERLDEILRGWDGDEPAT